MESRYTKLAEPMFEGDVETVPQTVDEAKKWLSGLFRSEKYNYHIDDNPREIVSGSDSERTFTDEQADHLDDCLEACTLLLGDWSAVWDAFFDRDYLVKIGAVEPEEPEEPA